METLIELGAYVRKDTEETMTCEECMEKKEQFGFMLPECKGICEGLTVAELEEELDNYITQKVCVRVSDINRITQSPQGRVIIQFYDDEASTLFSDTYKDVVGKLREHIKVL